jgi:hypothetical protein
MGGFSLEGETIRFSQLASTRIACSPDVMAHERRYTETLGQVRRWSIDKRSLILQDASGKTLLLFQASETPRPEGMVLNLHRLNRHRLKRWLAISTFTGVAGAHKEGSATMIPGSVLHRGP